MRLFLGIHRVSRSPQVSSRILKVYTEALNRFVADGDGVQPLGGHKERLNGTTQR